MSIRTSVRWQLMLVLIGLLVAASSQGDTGQTIVHQGYMPAPVKVSGPLLENPPESFYENPKCFPDTRGNPRHIFTPMDPRYGPDDCQPNNLPTMLNMQKLSGAETGFRSPGDFAFYRHHVFTGAEIDYNTGYVAEPSIAMDGRVVFSTGNFFACVSGDYGQTFSYICPWDNFPPDGHVDPVNGNFCCDQMTYFEPSRRTFYWLLQYHADDYTNTQRLAVAKGQEDVLNNTWYLYDWTPANFGYGDGYWLDFPDLTVSDNYLYLVTKVHPLAATKDEPKTLRNIIARFPLDELSQGQGFGYSYAWINLQGVSCTDGADEVMYIGAHVSNTVLRVFNWSEATGDLNFTDVTHGPYNTGYMYAPAPDGLNFAGHADDWIWGAWRASGVLGFMWPACQGGGFPYPHVQVVRVAESNFTFLSQSQIWSTETAYIYPSVHPNNRGHLAGTLSFGGGDFYPGVTAYIADDYNGGSMGPVENYAFTYSTDGPSGNRWGDYHATRPAYPHPNTWAATGHDLQGGPDDEDAVVHWVWFGRERDYPPLWSHTVHVDRANVSGWEDGTLIHPYRNVFEGHFATMPGDSLIIKGGNYPETGSLNRENRIRNRSGTVTVGQ
jgi:hypothetical protein